MIGLSHCSNLDNVSVWIFYTRSWLALSWLGGDALDTGWPTDDKKRVVLNQ